MSQATDIEASQTTRANNLEETPKLVRVDNNRAAIKRTRFSTLRAVHTIDNLDERPTSRFKQSTAEKRRRISYAPGTTLVLDDLQEDGADDDDTKIGDKAVMVGWLHKTSRHKTAKAARSHRQYRRFRLTAHSLQYDQLFQKPKLFPLTSIIDIIYEEHRNPLVFKLIFQSSELILEAPNQQNCIQWVENIRKEWERWNITCKQFNILLRTDDNSTNPEAELYLKENQDYFETAKRHLEFTVPGLVTGPCVAEKYFTMKNEDSATHSRHKVLQKFQSRVGLAPRVQRSRKLLSHEVGGKNDHILLNKCNFVMIKYPRKGHSMPHERAFKMDYENLLIMWHRTEDSKFSYIRTVMTEHIVDVREGQNSCGFDRYPYDELEDQSLSILVEGEKQTVPGGRSYAVLESLDLICESPEEYRLWYHTLRKFISPKFHLYSSRYESVDPAILWLVTHWSILTDNTEIREDAMLLFGSNLVPHIVRSRMQELLTRSHQCQLQESEHHGNSLHWDGFILFFNLLCGIDESNCLLLKIFHEYATTYPSLGMTVEQFQDFLIDHQHWEAEAATNEKCVQLMIHYDYHYRAYKMHKAKSTPVEFYISLCLLSLGGFLSFLRSPDNSVVDRKHEEVYQDMTQPLSHYFINSSHNTYLEGHQLTGRSTTDAYVRALLQGCRCLELDCWDGPNGEPKVTHGNTFVSDLSLEEVAETIDKYAFIVSTYPLILSLENHCCPDQQVRMAEIFMNIFGDKLAKENLVELNNLDRLPSPHQLQGKIILKGAETSKAKSAGRLTLMLFKLSLTSTKESPKEEIISPTRKTSEISVTSDVANIFQYPATYEQNDFLKQSPEDSNGDEINAAAAADDDDDNNYYQNNWSEKLSDLIIYCRTKYIKPWSWDKQKETSVCNMFSFNEAVALSKCKDTSKLLACTERQLVRTYPAGTRIDSSNYDPISMWNHGIQLVALNIQTPENFMFLNQGKFRQNGGCGYVLKPKVMNNPNGTEYSPNMNEPCKEITPVDLEITPLSGQHFIVFSKKTISMEIQYETYGIPHDCEKKKLIINSNETNPLWPQFQDASPLEKTIYMPGLCLVLFAVYIRINRRLKAGTKQILLGQNVLPLDSLKPGLHFIPLRTPSGASASHIGLFAKINMRKLTPNQASSFGICSKHPLHIRWSSSKLLETSPSIPDEEVENTTIITERECNKFKEKTTYSFSSAAVDENLERKKSRITRQKAVVQCTAEVHIAQL